MDWTSFLLGILIGFAVGLVANCVYDQLKSCASKSLRKGIKVKPVEWCKSSGDEVFWAVQLLVGSGNWLAKLLGDRAKLEISPLVRFEGTDGTKVHALVFRVDPQVINIDEMRQTFEVTRNINVMIAIVKRSGSYLYHFGGYASEMPLSGTYDATIIIRDRGFNPISEHPIENYIRDGNVVVDKTNDSEV